MKSIKIKKWSIFIFIPIIFIAIFILFTGATWEMIKSASCHSKYNNLTPLDWEDGDMNLNMFCVDTYIEKYSRKIDKPIHKYDIDDIKNFSDKFIENKENIPVFVKYYCDEFLTRSAARSNEVCVSFYQPNDLMKKFEDNKSSSKDNNDLEKDNNKNSDIKNKTDNTDFINEEDNSNKNDIYLNKQDKKAIDNREELKAEISKEVQELNTKIMDLENKLKDL